MLHTFLTNFRDVFLFSVLFFIWFFPKLYSATEGADSRPASGPGTPTDEKAGQVGMGKKIENWMSEQIT